MIKPRSLPGFTLVEILASVVIFASVIGILFSALAGMQRTDLFRRDNQALSQAAAYAFEPIIQSLKEADAKETVKLDNGACVTVQGYYATTRAGDLPSQPLLTGGVYNFTNGIGNLVVITAERSFDGGQLGSTRTWVRRDYYIKTSTINGRTINTLVEKTYKPENIYTWPAPLRSAPNSCDFAKRHWAEAKEPNGTKVEKELTARDINVKNFEVRLVHATVPSTGNDVAIEQNAPFITVALTVEKPTSNVAPPVTLRTTLTPTFSYGETREN